MFDTLGARKGGRLGEAATVRENLRRHIGDASRRLRAREAVSDAQIHAARKDLKRARAGLRLLRDAIGKRAYQRENAALRDAARPLGAVRDARVLSETLRRFLERGAAAERAVLRTLDTELQKDRHAAHEAIRGTRTLADTARALDAAWKRSDAWRLASLQASRVSAGLRRVYRRGRKALAAVEADPSDENLHEWRKQVKYLGNAMEILGPAHARAFAKHVKRTDAVAKALGDDHDLVVLHQRVSRVQAGSSKAHAALASRIARRRERLQSKALRHGRRLYDPKPKAFVERLRRDSRAAR